jgi:hypothetical protein
VPLDTRPSAGLAPADRTALAEEGEALLAFLAPGEPRSVRWSPWP